MDSALGSIVALVPAFKRSVVPPLNDGIAECLAVYWTIATANDSIDSASASQVAQRIIPLTIGQPWSSWNGREAAFQVRFKAMCQAMVVGKQAAFAMGAGRASAEDQRTLFIMNVAKAALASSAKDDTDETSVVSVMERLGEFHEKVWPIVRKVGQPRPMTSVVAQQETRVRRPSSSKAAREEPVNSGTTAPHPYYVAHYTEIESVVLGWRGQTEQDPKKVILATEVMEKMVNRKAMLLAGGLDPAEADEHRRRAEEDFDRENPGVRDQAYAFMRTRLAQWQAGQQTAKSGCVITLFVGLGGIAAIGSAVVKFIQPVW
jgi:hypothetical protein